jgi:hypothetical protein
MRIGWDLDGVLADLESALRREAHRLWPDPTAKAAGAPSGEEGSVELDDGELGEDERKVTPSTLALSPSQQHDLWHEVHRLPNFWESLDETEPGIVRRLGRVARARRWEVIFLTSRPRCLGDTVQVQSQRWLVRYGFEFPSVFVVKASRGRIAQALALDLLIDDRPENCLDIVLESSAKAILVWRGDEAAVPGSARRLGIGGVRSVAECLDILEEGPDPSSDKGFMDRIKRRLGLKASDSPAVRTSWSLDEETAASSRR